MCYFSEISKRIKEREHRFLVDALLSNRIFDKTFIDIIFKYALDYLILAYVYFEAIAVALMVNDISYSARLYAEIGELYNGSHRRMLFDLYPNFFNKFDVSLFRPELKVVIDYIESHKICNVQSFLSDFYLILTDLLRVALLNVDTYGVDKIENVFDIDDDLFRLLLPFIGHEIRLFKVDKKQQLLNYYDKFNTINAEVFWKKLSSCASSLCYNSIVPKGEMAFAPVNKCNVQVYSSEIIKNNKNGFYYANKKELLDIDVKLELTCNKLLMMNSHKI